MPPLFGLFRHGLLRAGERTIAGARREKAIAFRRRQVRAHPARDAGRVLRKRRPRTLLTVTNHLDVRFVRGAEKLPRDAPAEKNDADVNPHGPPREPALDAFGGALVRRLRIRGHRAATFVAPASP